LNSTLKAPRNPTSASSLSASVAPFASSSDAVYDETVLPIIGGAARILRRTTRPLIVPSRSTKPSIRVVERMSPSIHSW